MTTYRTNNPIGSTDRRDLFDNAENLDNAVNSTTSDAWVDRLGVTRKTYRGMQSEHDTQIAEHDSEFEQAQDDKESRFQSFLLSSGYEDLGAYQTGIQITARNQIVLSAGEYWRVAASTVLPYTTTGAGMPEGGAFVSVGDAALRQELAAPGGAGLVGNGGIVFDSVADMQAATWLQVGQKVRTLGYYSPGDGGNDYEIVAAATGTDDGGSFIDLGGSGLQARGLFVCNSINAAQFGASPEIGFDNGPAFRAASGYAKLTSTSNITIARGTFEVDTSIFPIRSTDSSAVFFGAGMRDTVIKATAACDDVFVFDTDTVLGGDRIPSGGLYNLSVDGSLLSKRCVKTVSTNFGFFDRLAISGALEDNFLATTQNGQPSSQHNRYGTLEILVDGAANGFRGTGSQLPGGNGNWSLNYVENIFTLLAGGSSGNGFVFGFSDGNYVAHLRNYRTPDATGRAVVFEGDDVGEVTGGAHSRLNVISHCQTGPAGCLAKAGLAFSSRNRIIDYSTGNGSPKPEIEPGAVLGFSSNTADGMRGTFVPGLIGTSGGGPVTYATQKGRYQITTGRVEFDLEVSISAANGLVGNIRIEGLPFPMGNTTGTDVQAACSVGRFKMTMPAGYTHLGAEVLQGQSAMQLMVSGSGLLPVTVKGADLNPDSVFLISGSYPL